VYSLLGLCVLITEESISSFAHSKSSEQWTGYDAFSVSHCLLVSWWTRQTASSPQVQYHRGVGCQNVKSMFGRSNKLTQKSTHYLAMLNFKCSLGANMFEQMSEFLHYRVLFVNWPPAKRHGACIQWTIKNVTFYFWL